MGSWHSASARLVRCVSTVHNSLRRWLAVVDAYRYLAMNEYTIAIYILGLALACAWLIRDL